MIWTHVSELAIDRMLAGEVAAADAAAMRDHAASCRRCGALLDDAVAVQREFAKSAPPLPIALPRRRVQVIAAVTALAAAVAVVLAWPRHEAAAPGEGFRGISVRTKGAAIVGFFVAHDGAVRRGGGREHVMPGDRIELVTTTHEAVWFAAIGDDASGLRSVYVEPRRIEAGVERVVPLSIELDDTLGDEVVTAIFCPDEFDVRAVPADCTRDRFTLVKVHR